MAIPLKKALRARMKTVTSTLSPQEVHRQSLQIVAHTQQCPWWNGAQRVGVYISFTGEVETANFIDGLLVRKAVDPGVRLFVPFIENPSESAMAFLEVESSADLAGNFAPNKWGILEPRLDTLSARCNVLRDDVVLDAVLVPGAAFDRRGGRCGRGKGFYDRFLSKLRQRVADGVLPKMPILAGLCLEEQLVDEVPMTEYDFLMDYVICPSGVLEAPNGRPLTNRRLPQNVFPDIFFESRTNNSARDSAAAIDPC